MADRHTNGHPDEAVSTTARPRACPTAIDPPSPGSAIPATKKPQDSHGTLRLWV